MAKKSEVKIYYGCERVEGLTEAKQPKNIKKPWFCYWRSFDKRAGKRGKMRTAKSAGSYESGINRFHTLKERLVEANNLKKSIEILLENGYNHFDQPEDFAKEQSTSLSILPICEALDWALEKTRPNCQHGTYIDRKSTLKYIKQAIKELKIDYVVVKDFRRFHAKQTLENIFSTRTISVKRQQAYKETFSRLFGELIEWDEDLEVNPIAKIRIAKAEESMYHLPLTPDELEIISDHLKQVDWGYYLYTKTLLRTGIRRKNLLGIKVGNLKPETKSILVLPDNHKNKTLHEVSIDDELFYQLWDFVKDCPPNYHIWSTDLLPGPKRVHPNLATAKWKYYVKDWLKINKTLYGLKHTRLDLGLRSGAITVGDGQILFGQKNIAMTRIYDKHNIEKLKAQERLIQSVPKF